MKALVKSLLLIAGFFVFLFLAGFIGWLIRDCQPPPSVTEQMKSIQRQTGCVKIDAEIGPETKRQVNAAVEHEKRKRFNEFVRRYMTPTGAPADK